MPHACIPLLYDPSVGFVLSSPYIQLSITVPPGFLKKLPQTGAFCLLMKLDGIVKGDDGYGDIFVNSLHRTHQP